MDIRLSKPQSKNLIKLVLHHYLEIFLYLKSVRNGELVWPEHLILLKNNLNLHNYVDLYEDERKIRGSMSLFFYSTDELDQLKIDEKNKSYEEKKSDLDELINDLLENGEAFLESFTNFDTANSEIPKELDPESIKRTQYLFLSTLALFHNVFSIMVFGIRLTTLVKKAINGDDASFLMAIKVDHNLLHHHPYFRNRMDIANNNQDVKFLKSVYEKQLSPSLNGRIKHRALYTMFYFLDEFRVLDDFSAPELHKLYLDCNLSELEVPTYESSSFAMHLKKFKVSK